MIIELALPSVILISVGIGKMEPIELLEVYRLHIYSPRLGPSYTRGPRPISSTYTQLQSNN
jgi:hypothetical protein